MMMSTRAVLLTEDSTPRRNLLPDVHVKNLHSRISLNLDTCYYNEVKPALT